MRPGGRNISARVWAASLLFVASAAGADPTPATDAERALEAQVADWNRGDLEAALQAYCPDSAISWVNASGLSHGFEPFARSMRESFAGRSEAMGTMVAERLETRDLGPGGTLLVIRWSIDRDGTRLMGGISSQLWAPCQGRTRIVFEHAS